MRLMPLRLRYERGRKLEINLAIGKEGIGKLSAVSVESPQKTLLCYHKDREMVNDEILLAREKTLSQTIR